MSDNEIWTYVMVASNCATIGLYYHYRTSTTTRSIGVWENRFLRLRKIAWRLWKKEWGVIMDTPCTSCVRMTTKAFFTWNVHVVQGMRSLTCIGFKYQDVSAHEPEKGVKGQILTTFLRCMHIDKNIELWVFFLFPVSHMLPIEAPLRSLWYVNPIDSFSICKLKAIDLCSLVRCLTKLYGLEAIHN